MAKITRIDGIGNYYGSLHVKNHDGSYYAKVYCEIQDKPWIEISKKLYDMLIALNMKN